MSSGRGRPRNKTAALRVIEICQFEPAWGVNLSPFCCKVETYCQLAGVGYSTKSVSPFKAPRGKLPFIVDAGKAIPDSARIIDHLKATRGDPLDAALTPAQQSIGHLLRQTCEHSLYFSAVYSRWIDDAFWPEVQSAFFGRMPPGVRTAVAALARRGIRQTLHAQGTGRLPPSEIYANAARDLSAIAAQLAQHEYAVGPAPSSFDACVYAFMHNILDGPLATPIKAAALQLPALVAYTDRMNQRLGWSPESKGS